MRQILIALFAALSLGFYVESPDAARERAREAKAWRREVKQKYDLTALHRFSKEELAAHGEVEGVSLASSKFGRKWKFDGAALVSGDWTFRSDLQSEEFTISWFYDEVKREDGSSLIRSVRLHCRRVSKRRFELIRASREEVEIIILSARAPIQSPEPMPHNVRPEVSQSVAAWLI